MYKRLISVLENDFIQNQFGFRKQHSTYMALMISLDKIVKSMEDGEYVIGIFSRFFKGIWYRWSQHIINETWILW